MIRLYTPIILIQIFCLFHIIRNKKEHIWYFLVIFIPLFGSLYYLYDTFVNKKNIEAISEEIKGMVNTNHEIQLLEQENNFKNTIVTRIALADAYNQFGRHKDAVQLYESCLEGIHENDPEIKMKMLKAYYQNSEYARAAEIGYQLQDQKSFNLSKNKIYYAWALAHQERTKEAQAVFSEMDHSFSNYPARIEYVKFLIELENLPVAQEKFKEINEEFESMTGGEKRHYKDDIHELKALRSMIE